MGYTHYFTQTQTSDVDEIKGWLDTILDTFDFELNTLFFWAWW
ncbi:hypothetical protein AB7X06_04565 [Providencia rettgeri]